MTKKDIKKNIVEPLVFMAVFIAFFGLIGHRMGLVNMLSTLMNTAYDLLMNTVFYIMAIAVLAGAIGAVLSEFGVIRLINTLVSPLMKPLYGLPGAASVGVMTTYLSDNPAILALADDKNFIRYFRKYQVPALTNIGTAFGMGAIITTFVIGLSTNGSSELISAAIVGNIGAVFGSIVSTRLMLTFTKREYGTTAWAIDDGPNGQEASAAEDESAEIREDAAGEAGNTQSTTGKPSKKSIGLRAIESMLTGGKSGVKIGLEIIPGVLIICSLVLMLTNGPSADGTYTGAAFEGVGVFPWIADKLSFILKPLFGFTGNECISIPITALGSAGAAIALIPGMLAQGQATGADVAVFTAMCMCWSGYLSTHVAMMDSLGARQLTGKAILCHTIGGICAGIFAHWVFVLLV
ncbi:MAG: hypothetical protein IKS99_08690 [Firmicutes bacterium]|nr:hypothetical protein [Bacillota bacterium]